ncbi:MAG: TPR end-of-group domain-containing protein, partial [Gammaproteobacteria bacterium]
IQKYSETFPFFIAESYAYRGDSDRAFEWLDKAVESKDPWRVYALTDPFLVSLHTDPRWGEFLRKIGRAPDQLAAIKFDVKVPQQ